MLNQLIEEKVSLCDEVNIEETLSHVNLKIVFGEEGRGLSQELLSVLKKLSPRDSFEMFFEISGDVVSVSSCNEHAFKKIQDHLHNNTGLGECEIELRIKKYIVDSVCSMYFLTYFAAGIKDKPPLELMKFFSSALDSHLYVEVFSNINEFGTKGIWFFSAISGCSSKVEVSKRLRSSKTSLFIENSGHVQIPRNLMPEDFFVVKNGIKELDDLFSCLCGIISLAFLVSELAVTDSWRISYRVNGYKTILVEEESCCRISEKSGLIYKIYDWAYEGGSNSDKLGLIRNVFSIHIDEGGKIKFDKEVWEAVQSNYQIYLQSNIESYLEVKGKITEIVIEFTGKTYAIADSVLDSFKNNIFVMVTFLLTVVVVNGLKDGGMENVFSSVYVGVVIILTLVSFIWLVMSRQEVKNRFAHASGAVNDILHINYKNLVMESEIKECTEPVIKKSKVYLYSQVDRYSCWWACILIVFLLSFLIAHFTFHGEEYSLQESRYAEKVSYNYSNFENDRYKTGRYGGVASWIYIENSNCLYCNTRLAIDYHGIISFVEGDPAYRASMGINEK